MPELVADCPRCPARQHTFDVPTFNQMPRIEHGWVRYFEFFGVCRNCHRGSIFVVKQKDINDKVQIRDRGPLSFKDSLNNHFEVTGYISLKDKASEEPPEHLPLDVEKAFKEGATCLAVGCWNAAGVMFRACLDLATRPLLPADTGEDAPKPEGLNWKVRRDLGLRLPWLFKHDLLPVDLEELSTCVQQDGNDGAHQVNLNELDARDLMDFAVALLERLFTEPARLELA